MSTELKNTISELNQAFEDFKARYDERIDNLELDLKQKGLGAAGDPGRQTKSEIRDALLPYFRDGDDSQIKNSMSVGSGADGGYSVIPQMDNVIREVAREISPVYALARKELCTTAIFETLVNTDLAGTSWVGETESRDAAASPGFKKIEIPVHEQSSLVEVTQRLVDDSAFDIENFVRRNVATAFGAAAGAAYITGNGVEKPMGILSYDTGEDDDDDRDWEKIQYVKTGNAGDFKASGSGPGDVFFDCMYAMKAPYLANAVWIMSRSTAAEARKLKDSNDNYLWTDSLQSGQPAQLIGFPVYLDENVPGMDTDSYSIMFANLQAAYCIPERPGVRYLMDPYTNKPFRRLYFTRRVGGSVVDFNAIKLIRFSS